MTSLKRPLATAGAAVLLALSLTACGGGGAPTDASKADFCDAVNNTEGGEEIFKLIEEEDWDGIADALQEQAEKIEEVGTPEGIPDDAREGFELQLEASGDLDGDKIKKAFEDQEDPFEADISEDDQDKVEAYNKYEQDTCADA